MVEAGHRAARREVPGCNQWGPPVFLLSRRLEVHVSTRLAGIPVQIDFIGLKLHPVDTQFHFSIEARNALSFVCLDGCGARAERVAQSRSGADASSLGYWSLLRHRESLIQAASSHVLRMQKALNQMNLQIHHIISDITGVTGLRIIEAVLA